MSSKHQVKQFPIEDLFAMLKHHDAEVRRKAIRFLGKYEPSASGPEIMERLLECVADKERFVRYDVVIALAELKTTPLLPALIARLLACTHDKRKIARATALSVVAELAEAAATPEVTAR